MQRRRSARSESVSPRKSESSLSQIYAEKRGLSARRPGANAPIRKAMWTRRRRLQRHPSACRRDAARAVVRLESIELRSSSRLSEDSWCFSAFDWVERPNRVRNGDTTEDFRGCKDAVRRGRKASPHANPNRL